MPKKIKGKISEYEREVMQRNLPMVEDDAMKLEGYISEAERRMMQDNMPEMKKGGAAKPTKAQKKIGSVMSDGVSKKGMGVEKRMGGGMMSDGVSKKGSGVEMKSKGGMVRGQGVAIRGTKFKGIF